MNRRGRPRPGNKPDDAEAQWWQVVEAEFHRLVLDWGLGTTLAYNGRLGRRTLAQFRWPDNIIEVGRLDHMEADLLVDSVRHEIAHAIEYALHKRTGHSARWRLIAMTVGAFPRGTAYPGERLSWIAALKESEEGG